MAYFCYKEYVCKHLTHLFTKRISYNRFVELKKEVSLPLTIFIKKVVLFENLFLHGILLLLYGLLILRQILTVLLKPIWILTLLLVRLHSLMKVRLISSIVQ